MADLRVAVTEVQGKCTACPPVKPGDYLEVSDGVIRIPQGGFVCIWALQSLMPIIAGRAAASRSDGPRPPKDRRFQCPDPKGRVLFEVVGEGEQGRAPAFVPSPMPEVVPDEPLEDLEVTVARVRGCCGAGMEVGHRFELRSGRIYIPPEQGFCLYALQAVLPLLPAKQRPLPENDWLRHDSLVICPDPEGSVVMRIATAK